MAPGVPSGADARGSPRPARAGWRLAVRPLPRRHSRRPSLWHAPRAPHTPGRTPRSADHYRIDHSRAYKNRPPHRPAGRSPPQGPWRSSPDSPLGEGGLCAAGRDQWLTEAAVIVLDVPTKGTGPQPGNAALNLHTTPHATGWSGATSGMGAAAPPMSWAEAALPSPPIPSARTTATASTCSRRLRCNHQVRRGISRSSLDGFQ